MNKKELASAVAGRLEMTKKDMEIIVDEVLATIQETLATGEPVKLYGFGDFEVKETAARKGRNPQTQEEIEIKASKKPKFKPLKGLKDAVAGK